MKTAIMAALIMVTPTLAHAEAKLEKWQKTALQKIKQEKKVLDVRWRSPDHNVLWASMTPDGTKHDGFAQYLCIVLMQSGAPDGDLKTVWIYDPATFESGGSAMGMAACR